MDVETIQKILQQQEQVSIFLVDIQCQPFGYLITQENRHTLYCGKGCLKKFSESLREHGKSVIDYEIKRMLILTQEELESHQDAKMCNICGKKS